MTNVIDAQDRFKKDPTVATYGTEISSDYFVMDGLDWGKYKDKYPAKYKESPLEELAGNCMTTHCITKTEIDMNVEHERGLLHNALHDIEITRDAIDLRSFKEKEQLDILQTAVGKLLEELSQD